MGLGTAGPRDTGYKLVLLRREGSESMAQASGKQGIPSPPNNPSTRHRPLKMQKIPKEIRQKSVGERSARFLTDQSSTPERRSTTSQGRWEAYRR